MSNLNLTYEYDYEFCSRKKSVREQIKTVTFNIWILTPILAFWGAWLNWYQIWIRFKFKEVLINL